MGAYYNECDALKAEILREAIKANAIAPGDVDERSITDVEPDDLVGYTQCHFFAGDARASSQDLGDHSAYGQSIRGTSDRAPKPFLAIPDYPLGHAHQIAHIPAYGQSQLHGIHRTLHMREARLDTACKSAQQRDQQEIALWHERDRSFPSMVVVHGIRGFVSCSTYVGTLRNKAICCAGLDLSKNACHTNGNHDLPGFSRCFRELCGNGICNGRSRIFYGSEKWVATRMSIGCKSLSYKEYPTSYDK